MAAGPHMGRRRAYRLWLGLMGCRAGIAGIHTAERSRTETDWPEGVAVEGGGALTEIVRRGAGMCSLKSIRHWMLVAMALALVGLARRAGAELVWWEAEAPAATNLSVRHAFSPQNRQEAEALSGGQWIGTGGAAGKALFLEYQVTVLKDGQYGFYARKFWKHGPFRWRFDEQAWGECGKEIALLDSVDIRPFVVVNWVALGEVKLGAGAHRLRIELLEPQGPAAFDCFVLSTDPFAPRGKLKPAEKSAAAPAGWFAFDPPADTFGGVGAGPAGV